MTDKREWTTVEDKLIRSNARKLTAVELAEMTGRTESSVRGYIRHNKIKVKTAQRRLSTKQIEYIKRHTGVDMTPAEVASALDLDVSTVRRHARTE